MDLRQRRRGTRRRGCDHPSADPTDRGPGRRSAVRRGLPGERSDGGRLAPSQRGATSHRVGTASAAGAARLVGAQGGRRGGPPGGLSQAPVADLLFSCAAASTFMTPTQCPSPAPPRTLPQGWRPPTGAPPPQGSRLWRERALARARGGRYLLPRAPRSADRAAAERRGRPAVTEPGGGAPAPPALVP